MKQQTLLIGILSGSAVLIIVVALSLAFGVNFGGSGQAQETLPTPLLQMPEYPPTPTVAPPPVDEPQPAATALFAADFTDPQALDNWTIVELDDTVIPEARSLWAIEDGRLVQNRTAAANNPSTQETLAVIGDASWTDYAISAKVYNQTNATFGLVARYQDGSFYRYRSIANRFESTPKQVLEKVVDGVPTTLATVDQIGHDEYRWYSVTLRVNGTTIQALVDGKVVAEADDATLTNGQAGVYTRALGGILFDDITVTAQ